MAEGKRRGRPPGSKSKPKDGQPTAPTEGRNELTDEQRQALFFQHKKRYESALAAKKAADADLKNVCKTAKAELGDDAVPSIKDAIALETEEGEAKIHAEIERKLRVARWMAVPLGSQADMFGEPDRTPAVDRAYAEGKRDGMAGKTLISPYAPELPQNDRYITGWHDGQRAVFNIQRAKDAEVFESADAGTSEPAPDAPSGPDLTPQFEDDGEAIGTADATFEVRS